MYFSSFLLVLLASPLLAQRVAPGVNPQHYQQPPPPQHGQYQQQQYQQPPQQQYQQPQVPHQQNQVPQQQQQAYQQQQPVQGHGHHQQQQQQQQPHQAGHQPHHPHPQQVLNAGNIQEERAHIQEHMEVPIDTSKMSEAELQFHYFKMHDSDNNNKLDGCELIKSLIHWHETGGHHHEHDDKEKTDQSSRTDDQLADLIDPLMKMMDINIDGYISWEEYRESEKNMKNSS